jgi:hypothetical protein
MTGHTSTTMAEALTTDGLWEMAYYLFGFMYFDAIFLDKATADGLLIKI